MVLRILLAALAVLAVFVPSAVVPESICRAVDHAGARYTVCRVDLARDDLRVFWSGADDRALGSFDGLARHLAAKDARLAFAVNAGMYHPGLEPVGLLIEDGVQRAAVNTADAPGNFFLKPNGIFWIGDKRAGVTTTEAWLAAPPEGIRHATQSGPMLLIDGAPHPRFLVDSDSRKIRNGVAVLDGHAVVFAVSEDAVTFHDFALFYRDRIGARDALFLDGTISSLHVPDLGRSDAGYPLGPILGVVERPR